MTDTFEAKGKRKKLVAELRKKGITDEEVLRAIDTVPRHSVYGSCIPRPCLCR